MSQLGQERANWICDELNEKRRVDLTNYTSHIKKVCAGARMDAPTDDSIRVEWTRLTDGIFAACQQLNVPGIRLEDQVLSCDKFETARHESANFRTFDKSKEKEAIGTLVAEYLKLLETKSQEANSLFLGSGSSVFWVGRAMAKLSPWHQIRQICTVNVALLSYWSELTRKGAAATDPKPPSNSVKIPEGLYEPALFRYTTMKNLHDQDEVGITVVGADGCKYDAKKPSVYLFPTSDNIGENTIRLIKMALIAVICCLTSDKIKEKPPTGPCLRISGRREIPCYLVTDQPLDDKIKIAFAEDNWHVVARKEDWDYGSGSRAKSPKK